MNVPSMMQFSASLEYSYRSTSTFNPGKSDGFHSHPHYEIYYFHDGECTYIIGDRVYNLEPGDLVLMHEADPSSTTSEARQCLRAKYTAF